MGPKDWFGVVVRALGLWNCVQGAVSLLLFIGQSARMYSEASTSMSYRFMYSIAYLGFGIAMLFGADAIVRGAYRTFEPPPEEDAPSDVRST